MELKQYAILLWRWLWLIVLAAVLAATGAYISGSMQTPIYQASTTVLIDQAPDARTSDYTALILSQQLASTYSQLMTKRPVLEEVSDRLGLSSGPNSLRGSIQVSPIRDTQLIEITAQHSDPFLTAEIANTLVSVFRDQNAALQASRYAASKESMSAQLAKLEEQIQQTEASILLLESPRSETSKAELERLQSELTQYQTSYTALLQSYEGLRLSEAKAVSNIVQVESAVVPTSPIRPRIFVNTLLAMIVGAMLAIGVIFLIEYLDDTIKSTEETSQSLGLPVIGFLARMDPPLNGTPHVILQPRSPISEAFRSLRSNIQFASVDRPIRCLLVTSPAPREGKSTVAANLAVVMAQGGKRVLLLDGDLRKPRLHDLMGVPNRLGMSDFFMRHPSELGGIIRRLEEKDLYLVTSGKLPPNPAELLGSERMLQIIHMLKGKYDFIIIDSPPVGAVTDATVLASRVDGVLMVVEPKKTRLGAAAQAVEQLRRADANLIGIVFNNVPIKRAGYYAGYASGYYCYQYAYSYGNGRNGKGPVQPKKRKKKQAPKAKNGGFTG